MRRFAILTLHRPIFSPALRAGIRFLVQNLTEVDQCVREQCGSASEQTTSKPRVRKGLRIYVEIERALRDKVRR